VKIVYPLRRRRDQFTVEATNGGRFLGNFSANWTGDGQKATNGSRDPVPSRPLLNGYPYQYACPVNQSTKSVQLIFDYEVVFRGNSSTAPEFWTKDLYALEWGLLYMVADRVGMRSCNYSQQDGLTFPAQDRVLPNEEPPRIVSLMSTRQDAPDMTARKYSDSYGVESERCVSCMVRMQNMVDL
jgi:hypothetical protein